MSQDDPTTLPADAAPASEDPPTTEDSSSGEPPETPESAGAASPTQLPTGVDALDDHLDGGLYPGDVVALLADPTSQAELLLARIAGAGPTLYLTFQRTPEAVRRSLARLGVTGSPDGQDEGEQAHEGPAIDERLEVRALDPEDPVASVREHVLGLDGPTTVIVDPATGLEAADGPALWDLLSAASAHLATVGGYLVCHCLRGPNPPGGRDSLTYMADVVFLLETDYGLERIENHLLVPKRRGGRPVPHALKLELTDEVRVDTSRDIA